MWNNYVSTGSDRCILILALDSGAGHRVRMESLKRQLDEKGIPAHLRMIADDEEQARQIVASGPVDLVILDARDMDPGAFGDTRVLAIDNMHARRKSTDSNIVFYDTLPHPDLDDRFDEIFRRILFDDEVMERIAQSRRPALPGTARITFYAGPEGFMDATMIDEIDTSMTKNDMVLYTRVGGKPGGPATIFYLTRSRCLDLLLDTDIILTYPGMTFWEAMLLGANPVLLETGSAVHDRLSEYLSRKTGARWFRSFERREGTTAGMILDAMARSLSVDLQAWRKDVIERPGLGSLVRTVEELWNDSRKRSPRS